MTAHLLVPFPEQQALAQGIARPLQAEIGILETRRFPDDETYLRYSVDVAGKNVAILCSLDHPDGKILPLLFAAAAARDLGAASVGLIAPYLAYMRQDRRFRPGEAVTARHFADLLSQNFDWLVTVDPHLHRFSTLSEIFSIPTKVAHAAPLISDWIRREINKPLLVGPDSESEQWVSAVAAAADVPHIVLQKIRHGDRDVEVSVPDVDRWRGRTPILVDDIVSTAGTMIRTISHLKQAGMAPPICIGVHGLFAGNALAALRAAGAARIITTNTVIHASNEIEVSKLLCEAMMTLTSAEAGLG
jgi:ribose-phosphate pyrophosphokinase